VFKPAEFGVVAGTFARVGERLIGVVDGHKHLDARRGTRGVRVVAAGEPAVSTRDLSLICGAGEAEREVVVSDHGSIGASAA
jgi:hypothetical protein